jgi:hypothetical protein
MLSCRAGGNDVRDAGVMAREWKDPSADRVVSIPTFAPLTIAWSPIAAKGELRLPET